MTKLNLMPNQIATFTIPQLICLFNKQPPGDRKLSSYEEFLAAREEIARADTEWNK